MPGWALILLAAIGWVLTAVLIHLARGAPRSGPLTERAVVGVVLEAFVTLFAFVAVDRDLPVPIIDEPTHQSIVRYAVVIVALIPAYWVYEYLSGRLGK